MEKEKRRNNKKKERIDGFGMIKDIPKFKRDRYEHEDLWD